MTAIQRYNLFCEAAMLNKQHDPWVKKREPGKEYANFLIIKCRHPEWWYRDFIGIEFFGEIKTHSYRETEVIAVRLTGTKIHKGRDIPIGDLIML